MTEAKAYQTGISEGLIRAAEREIEEIRRGHAESRVVLFLDHDFNKARGRGGFHEVVLDKIMERNVHSGDVVDIGDEDYKARGRVRCLIAIVEDAPEESR